jgi:hypothetical protein
MGITDRGQPVPDYLDRKQMTDVFDSIAPRRIEGYDVGVDGSPLRLSGDYVTPSYFQVLGAAPMLGRIFTESEALLGNEACAILSYGLWKEMFGRDPEHPAPRYTAERSALPDRRGHARRLRRARPRKPALGSFRLHSAAGLDNARTTTAGGMIARLKAGVSVAYAQQRVDALNASLAEEFPKYRKMLEDSRFRTKVVAAE